jgi:hypothetical protein
MSMKKLLIILCVSANLLALPSTEIAKDLSSKFQVEEGLGLDEVLYLLKNLDSKLTYSYKYDMSEHMTILHDAINSISPELNAELVDDKLIIKNIDGKTIEWKVLENQRKSKVTKTSELVVEEPNKKETFMEETTEETEIEEIEEIKKEEPENKETSDASAEHRQKILGTSKKVDMWEEINKVKYPEIEETDEEGTFAYSGAVDFFDLKNSVYTDNFINNKIKKITTLKLPSIQKCMHQNKVLNPEITVNYQITKKGMIEGISVKGFKEDHPFSKCVSEIFNKEFPKLNVIDSIRVVQVITI